MKTRFRTVHDIRARLLEADAAELRRRVEILEAAGIPVDRERRLTDATRIAFQARRKRQAARELFGGQPL